jgi:hypothetical protein
MFPLTVNQQHLHESQHSERRLFKKSKRPPPQHTGSLTKLANTQGPSCLFLCQEISQKAPEESLIRLLESFTLHQSSNEAPSQQEPYSIVCNVWMVIDCVTMTLWNLLLD